MLCSLAWRTPSLCINACLHCACFLLGPRRLWRKGALAAERNCATCGCCHQMRRAAANSVAPGAGSQGFGTGMRPMLAWFSLNPRKKLHGALGRWKHLPLQQFARCSCPHVACRFGFHFSQPTRGWVGPGACSCRFRCKQRLCLPGDSIAEWPVPGHQRERCLAGPYPAPCRAAVHCFGAQKCVRKGSTSTASAKRSTPAMIPRNGPHSQWVLSTK